MKNEKLDKKEKLDERDDDNDKNLPNSDLINLKLDSKLM